MSVFRSETVFEDKNRHVTAVNNCHAFDQVSFSLTVSDMKSLDFTVTRFLMKLFRSSNINLINDSRYYFNFELPSELLMKRKDKFTEKFMASQRLLDYFAIQ